MMSKFCLFVCLSYLSNLFSFCCIYSICKFSQRHQKNWKKNEHTTNKRIINRLEDELSLQQKEKDKLEVSQFEEKNKSGALDKSVETLRNKLDVMEQELEIDITQQYLKISYKILL